MQEPVEPSGLPTPRQIRAARVILEWSQDQLAAAADIGRRTLIRIESGTADPKTRTATLEAIATALSGMGIVFVHFGDCRDEGVILRAPDREIMVRFTGPEVVSDRAATRGRPRKRGAPKPDV